MSSEHDSKPANEGGEPTTRARFMTVHKCPCANADCEAYWIFGGYMDDGIAQQKFAVPDIAALRAMANLLTEAVELAGQEVH